MNTGERGGSKAVGHDLAKEASGPEAITGITEALRCRMGKALASIGRMNIQSRILALNAQVESTRAGQAGLGFGVVASEMTALSARLAALVEDLESQTALEFQHIADINEHISQNFRGTRLSDLALTNVDLIDRNLYERTCDVRWWATDPSLVDALSDREPGLREVASSRLGVILDSYTVYFDLVLVDRQGVVVANGRPGEYASVGTSVQQEPWFRQAMQTKSGDSYGFQTVHKCPLVHEKLALVYSTAVRQRGEKRAPVIGALGVVFRYEDLAQTIVKNAPLLAAEKTRTRVCIVDDTGTILADTKGRLLGERLEFLASNEAYARDKGFVFQQIGGKNCCVGFAKAPGYETYCTGWKSLIIQEVES